jgi:hypothetical protein
VNFLFDTHLKNVIINNGGALLRRYIMADIGFTELEVAELLGKITMLMALLAGGKKPVTPELAQLLEPTCWPRISKQPPLTIKAELFSRLEALRLAAVDAQFDREAGNRENEYLRQMLESSSQNEDGKG